MKFSDIRCTADGDQHGELSGLKTPFAFVHIPKCSGTAFENYILSQGVGFEKSRAFTGLDRNDKPESLEMYFRNEGASPFVFGHFYYKDLLRFCPGAFLATFVRDPLKRTISQYKSWHDEKNFQPDDPHYKVANTVERDALVFAQRASLEEFVCSDNAVIVDGALGNQQTMYLSTYSGDDLAQHLESAKKNLAALDFFGITESFPESLELLRCMIPDLSDYKIGPEMENRSRISVDQVSNRAREIIAGQVEYDQKLYEYACQLFKERLQEWRASPRSTYSVKGFGRRAEDAQEYAPDGQPSGGKNEATQLEISALKSENERIETENRMLRSQLEQLEVAHLRASELNQNAVRVAQESAAEVDAENGLLRTQLAHLGASHMQLQQVYRDIVGSRSWRVMQTLQSVLKPFLKK